MIRHRSHRHPFPVRPGLVRLAAVVTTFWFWGCDSAVIVRHYHDSGQLIEEQACLKVESGREGRETLIPHGLRVQWDTNGNRRRLEVYNRGKRVGYVLTWDETGRVRREVDSTGFQVSYAGNPVPAADFPGSR